MKSMKAKARLHARYRGEGKGKKLIGYYAEFYDPGRRPQQKRIPLKTKDEVSARHKLTSLERDYSMNLFDPWIDPIQKSGTTLDEASKRFLKSREGRSKKTILNYADILRIFERSLPVGCFVEHVEVRHVKAFLEGQKINLTSRKTYLRHLNVFFNWAKKEKLTELNPVAKINEQRKGTREARNQHRFLTEEEVQGLIRSIDEGASTRTARKSGRNETWLSAIVLFAVNTGLRRGEVCNLQWNAFTLSEKMMRVQNTDTFQTKSGEERTIFLAGPAWAIIQRLAEGRTSGEGEEYVFKGPEGGKVREEYLSKRFRYYRKKAELPEGISFHDLRHTFASWAVKRGMDLYRLKEIMGHSDIRITMRYAHLRPDAMRQDMERFFGDEREEPLHEENKRLRKENEELRQENVRLNTEVVRLKGEADPGG